MATPVERLDVEQTSKAFTALIQWQQKQAEGKSKTTTNLFEDGDKFYLQVQLKETPQHGNNIVPKPVPIPHPIHKKPDICVIVREPLAQYQKKFEQSPIDGVKLIISINQLRKDHKEYADRRKLANSYDLFFADQAIQKFLPKLLGKSFYTTRKHPMLVTFNRDWAQQILKGVNGTNLHIGTANCFSIVVGRSNWEVDHLVENAIAVMQAVAKKLPKHWEAVQCVSVKLPNSPSLPIYSALPITSLKMKNPKAKRQIKTQKQENSVEEDKESVEGVEKSEENDEEEEKEEPVVEEKKKPVVEEKKKEEKKQKKVEIKPLKQKTGRGNGGRYFGKATRGKGGVSK